MMKLKLLLDVRRFNVRNKANKSLVRTTLRVAAQLKRWATSMSL